MGNQQFDCYGPVKITREKERCRRLCSISGKTYEEQSAELSFDPIELGLVSSSTCTMSASDVKS